jgi:hypothetical protein
MGCLIEKKCTHNLKKKQKTFDSYGTQLLTPNQFESILVTKHDTNTWKAKAKWNYLRENLTFKRLHNVVCRMHQWHYKLI